MKTPQLPRSGFDGRNTTLKPGDLIHYHEGMPYFEIIRDGINLLNAHGTPEFSLPLIPTQDEMSDFVRLLCEITSTTFEQLPSELIGSRERHRFQIR